MHTLKIMSVRGHDVLTWDPEVADTVAEAARIIAEHQAKGAALFATYPGQADPAAHTRIEAFDPRATEVVVIPHMKGG